MYHCPPRYQPISTCLNTYQPPPKTCCTHKNPHPPSSTSNHQPTYNTTLIRPSTKLQHPPHIYLTISCHRSHQCHSIIHCHRAHVSYSLSLVPEVMSPTYPHIPSSSSHVLAIKTSVPSHCMPHINSTSVFQLRYIDNIMTVRPIVISCLYPQQCCPYFTNETIFRPININNP